jgi:Ankyrin repeats (3 copies)
LIDNGIDIDAKNHERESTALHLAIEAKNSKLISLLVHRHADVNAVNVYDETALHIAARNNLTEACALLLMHGANISPKNIHDETPLYCAVGTCNANLVSLLLDHGASIYNSNRIGNLPTHALHITEELKGNDFERKFLAVVALLIKAGADTTGIKIGQKSEKKGPTLRDILSKSSKRHLDKEPAVLKISSEIKDDHREISDQADISLKEYRGSANVIFEGRCGLTHLSVRRWFLNY